MKLPSGFDTPVIIGHGSFGTVYRVRQKQLDRNVVIKMIPLSKRNLRERRFQEAVTLAQLNIPCIPQIYDVFVWKSNVCIVMQWIRSLNLQECLSMHLSKECRIEIADRLIKAVALLHEKGYAHRDLKPANVLISPSDGIYLIDFGFTSKNGSNNSGVIKGTPGFMPPEIFDVENHEIDYFRADCYALGVILENILGFDSRFSFVKTFTESNSKNRPSNAVDAHKLWTEQNFDLTSNEFSTVVDCLVRKQNSELLINNSSRLLKENRHNEAYRLYLECIQEIPDNPDVLKMMSTFSSYTRNKKNIRTIVLSGITIFTVVSIFIIYLLVQKSYKSHDSIMEITQNPLQKSFHNSISVAKNNVSIEYRHKPSVTPALTSDIYFSLKSMNCSIYIDGRFIGKEEKNGKPVYCNLPAGDYRVTFIGDDGWLIFSEHILVLPFCKMYVNAVVPKKKRR